MSVYDLSVPRPPAIDPAPEPARPPLTARAVTGALTVLAAVLYVFGLGLGFMLVPILIGGRWMFAAIATGWDGVSTSWRETGRIDP